MKFKRLVTGALALAATGLLVTACQTSKRQILQGR